MIDTVLFDLDGTLTDPKVGITKSVQYSLRKFDIAIENLDELDKFIGPPLKESYMKYQSFSEEDAIRAIDYYREYFSEQGIFENAVYPGVIELLITLKKRGVTVAVATSKPTFFAEKIISHFEMDRFFDGIIGSNLDNSRTQKKEIIAYALDKLGKGTGNAVMIGDRKHDLIGARANSVKSIGVLYGYGGSGEIEQEKPDYIAENVGALGDILKDIVLP